MVIIFSHSKNGGFLIIILAETDSLYITITVVLVILLTSPFALRFDANPPFKNHNIFYRLMIRTMLFNSVGSNISDDLRLIPWASLMHLGMPLSENYSDF